MRNLELSFNYSFDNPERLLIVMDRENERLSSVPDDTKTLLNELAIQHEGCGRFNNVKTHSVRVVTVRQIAVIALNIAERCRLEHEDF
jgi:hypothetical protein